MRVSKISFTFAEIFKVMSKEKVINYDEKDFMLEGTRLIHNNHKVLTYMNERNYWENKYERRDFGDDKVVSVEQIAQDYGLSEEELYKLLVELEVYGTVWDGYLVEVDYVRDGYTKSTLVGREDSKGVQQLTLDTKWTRKGYKFLQDLLKKHGRFKLTKNEN